MEICLWKNRIQNFITIRSVVVKWQAKLYRSLMFNATKLILLDSLIDLYNFACHFTTIVWIVMKFWILFFQRHISILYFWSQAYRPTELVVNVLWKWLIWPILQRNWAKTSNPVSTMGPGVNLTFFGPIGSHFMWKDCLHEKIPSTSNFFFVHKTTLYKHFPGRCLPY